jgi:hypothetical protein
MMKRKAIFGFTLVLMFAVLAACASSVRIVEEEWNGSPKREIKFPGIALFPIGEKGLLYFYDIGIHPRIVGKDGILFTFTYSKEPVREIKAKYNKTITVPDNILVWEVYCGGQPAYYRVEYRHGTPIEWYYERVYMFEETGKRTYFVVDPMDNTNTKWKYIEINEENVVRIQTESGASDIFYDLTGGYNFKKYAEEMEQNATGQAILRQQLLKQEKADVALGVGSGRFRIPGHVNIAGKIDNERYIFHVFGDEYEYFYSKDVSGYRNKDYDFEELVVRGKNLENCGAKVIGKTPTFRDIDSIPIIAWSKQYTYSFSGNTYGWVLRERGTTTIITQAGFYREVPLYEFVGINSEAIFEFKTKSHRDGHLKTYWY